MSLKKCTIVSNGIISDYDSFKALLNFEAGFIICADGAMRHLREVGVFPDLIVGDLDSADPDDIKFYESHNVEFEKFDNDKDFTDTELCFEIAVQKGFNVIHILAAFGNRIDHTLANIGLFRKADMASVRLCILDEKNVMYSIVGDGKHIDKIEVIKKDGWFISLIPLTEKCEGVSCTGTKYILDNEILFIGESRSVSNEFVDDAAYVSVKNGILLIIISKD